MNGNNFMAWVLRSPFHGIMSKSMMLITMTGRKTGKKITTPVGYYEADGYLWTVSSRNRTWWKNLQGGAEVQLHLKGKPVRAFSDVELDVPVVASHLMEFFRHVPPQTAANLGVRMEDNIPNTEDVARLAKERLFVKTKLLD